MKRMGFRRLLAWLTSFLRASRDGITKHRGMVEKSASPALIFIAVTLFLILAILEVDQHRVELSTIGAISSKDGVWLIGP